VGSKDGTAEGLCEGAAVGCVENGCCFGETKFE